jgi:hypothetical protein
MTPPQITPPAEPWLMQKTGRGQGHVMLKYNLLVILQLFESNFRPSMEMSFFGMPFHRLEQWAFQNGAQNLSP